MNCAEGKIVVPRWISCHTYLFGSPDSRTYISDERKHVYVLLEGPASDMWKLICDGAGDEQLAGWAARAGVEGQVEGFIGELLRQGLLAAGDERERVDADARFEPFGEDADSGEEAKFIEEMQTWMYEKKFLFSLFIELTYRCNLKCVHCYNPKDAGARELDFDLCKKAIDDAWELGCFRVTFSGGECTLHSRFAELVRYAKSKRISVEIFTNGQLMAEDESLCREILGQYPYRIGVSLYSTDKTMHERVTSVKGSFEKTYSLIKKLRSRNVNVQIKNFLLNFNCFDCIGVKRFADAIGATSVADISLIPTIEGDKSTLRYALDEDELIKLYGDPASPLYVGKGFVPLDFDEIKDDTPCLGGFTGLCVTPSGGVVVCVSLPLPLGDLNRTSLTDIWLAAARGEQSSALYRWQSTRISDFAQCYKEEYCRFCNLCPGMGYLENGYLKRSDTQCRQAKARMKAYMRIRGER